MRGKGFMHLGVDSHLHGSDGRSGRAEVIMRPDLDSSRTRMVGVSNHMSVRAGLNDSAYLKTDGPPLNRREEAHTR